MMTTLNTPLPTLILNTETAWHWPHPSYARRQVKSPLDSGEQSCRVETPAGAVVEGKLVAFDVDAGSLRLRLHAVGEPVALPFAKIRRLTLSAPWPIATRVPGAPEERAPNVVHERDYRIELTGGGELTGRSIGHVRQACGLFLYEPIDDAAAVQRVFVPDAALGAVSFGPSAEEQATSRWVTSPTELIAALDAQQRSRIRPLGQALLDLGLLTTSQLERALSQQDGDSETPLGEALVDQGLIDAADLQTALAYKMGYPMVDLQRFPTDRAVAKKLPQGVLLDYGVVPLMQLGDRLVVAIDSLSRVARLQNSQALIGLKLVPVLASRSRIALALAALPQRLGTDCWSENVAVQAGRRAGFGALASATA